MSEQGAASPVRWGDYGTAASRVVRELARCSPRYFSLLLAATVAQAALPAAQVWAVRALTDELSAGGARPTIVVLVVLVTGVIAAATVLGDGWHVIASVATKKLEAEGLAEIGESMARLRPADFADPELATRARAAREATSEFLKWHARAVFQAALGLVAMVLLLVALWPLSPLAALVLIGSLAASLPFLSRVAQLEAAAFPARAEHTKFASYYTEQLTYQRTASELVALGTGGRVAALARRRYLAEWRVFATMMMKTLRVNLLSGVLTALLAGLAIWIVTTNRAVGPGGVAAAVVAVLAGANLMLGMGLSIGTIVSGTGPVREFYRFVDAGRDRAPITLERRPVRELRCTDVGFTYRGRAEPALAGATLVASRGQMIALVGLNGAGKTTLVNCLAGLFEPSTGQVSLDGAPMTTLSDGERLGTVAMLTQEFGRYELTVREAVRLGSPRDEISDDEVWAALRAARAEEFVRPMPDGLDTQLGQQWGGVGLSGGQWQRLALARIALAGAPIWLLDEPTSAVDAVTEEGIFADLAATKAERITVIVSHRAWTLRSMDRIYVLERGRIVEEGSYPELLVAGGPFARMFAHQTRETGAVARAGEPEPTPGATRVAGEDPAGR